MENMNTPVCENLNDRYVYRELSGFADKEAKALRDEILNTENTEKYYKITGTKYYISDKNGNDCNDGRTPETAFKTTAALDDLALEFGDAVLFERGNTFRLKNQIMACEGVTYGSYGTGSKPKLFGSPKNYAVDTKWYKHYDQENVWWTIFPYHKVWNVVLDEGKYVGIPQEEDPEKKEGSFHHDTFGGLFFLYSEKGDPSKVYKSIEVCPSNSIFSVPTDFSNVTIDNLCMKYTAGGALSCSARNNNISVTNCEVGYIGGILCEPLKVRMGNAIGTWAGNKNLRVDHNWIYQTFDTAISPQGQYGDPYIDISFCNNLLEYNGIDFEIFDYEGSVFERVRFDNNIMRFTSLGWSNFYNGIQLRGIEGNLRAALHDVKLKDISFKNNIIDCPGRQLFNIAIDVGQLRHFDIRGNKIYYNKKLRDKYKEELPIIIADNIEIPEDSEIKVIEKKRKSIYANTENELKIVWKLLSGNDDNELYWVD